MPDHDEEARQAMVATASQISTVSESINTEAARLLNTDAFLEWFEKNEVKSAGLIVFNNSFLYRGTAGTTKNDKFLCVKMTSNGQPELPALVARPGGMNTQFRKVYGRAADEMVTEELHSAIKYELEHLGLVVRALIGRIGDDESVSISLESSKEWHTLRYEPKQRSLVELSGGEVTINRVDDLDVVWKAATDGLRRLKMEANEKFPEILRRHLRNCEKRRSDLSISMIYRPRCPQYSAKWLSISAPRPRCMAVH
jgi:hypothetical protein